LAGAVVLLFEGFLVSFAGAVFAGAPLFVAGLGADLGASFLAGTSFVVAFFVVLVGLVVSLFLL